MTPFDAALSTLSHSGERRLLLLTGSVEWVTVQAEAFWQTDALWLGMGPAVCRPVAINKAQKLLGREYRHVIFNGYSGLHPDMLAACAGMVRAGGLLILLMPPLQDWSQFQDPDQQRYVPLPEQAHRCHAFFLLRLRHLLLQSPHLWRWDEQEGYQLPSSPLMENWDSTVDDWGCLHPEQRQAVQQIIHCAQGHTHRPLVITADRGRGKSSALGIAAGRLLREPATKHGFQLLVTAPSFSSCHTLLLHAQRISGAAEHEHELQLGTASLQFYSPERLIDECPRADLLFIDEAAGIPVALLSALLDRYPRIIFATTLHGYEGSGQGFAVRMQQVLDSKTPDWQGCHLSHSVRWSSRDPLEPLINQLLLLATDAATPVPSTNVTHCWLTQQQLAGDEALLQQVFSLLVLAHYQTSPSDLRTLLDHPDLVIAASLVEQQVCGIVLVLREGELDPDLAEQIWLGRRRPRGHLIPQTLLTHAGFRQAGQFSYARIMRIAIHPTCQRRGLGQQLIQEVERWAHAQQLDFIGAAFAATEPLLRFWQRQHYQAVRLGLSRDAASGSHSIVVLKAIQPEHQPHIEQWQHALALSLPYYLPRQWRQLSFELVSQLVVPSPDIAPLSPQELSDLQAVAHGLRSPDHALPALQRWIMLASGQWLQLPAPDRCLLIRWLWQGWSWHELARETGLSGQKALIARLRHILRHCDIPPLAVQGVDEECRGEML